MGDTSRHPAIRRPAIWCWSLTALWLPLPFTVGRLVADATADASTALATVAVAMVWVGWVTALAASVLRRPAGLTAVRVAGIATIAATIATTVAANIWADAAPLSAPLVVVAASHAAVLAGVAHLAEIGNAHVDALSYGNERRILLRPPIGLLIGAVPLSCAVLIAGIAAGPLLIAAGRWLIGVPVGIVGITAAALAARALVQLARRWIVFVPNGLVLHDHLATREPVLIPQREVAQIVALSAHARARRLRAEPPRADRAGAGDAPAGSLDFTLGAVGVALEITTHSPVEFVKRPSSVRHATVESAQARQIVFCPTRPGAVLAEATSRRIGKPANAA